MAFRSDIRNIAIIAHVDHGKTTLVDAMLWQSGVFRANQDIALRVMDSMDLEREKGITILAKNTAIRYKDVKINIVDTPGHADFGGEVERALAMVDGVLLLVDASEGPLPQTRFVLKKSLEAKLPVILVINKVDRPDARISDVIDEVYELFLELGANESQIEFPILYTNAKAGTASLDAEEQTENLEILFEALLEAIPPPEFEENHPLQAIVTNLDSSPYIGRLAVCRILHGEIRKGQQIAWCHSNGAIERAKITELFTTEAFNRVETSSAREGEIIALAGISEVTVGDTLCDIDDPRPLDFFEPDEPSLAMTLGVNTSPFVGQDGTKLTARLLKDRLEQELIGNVSIRLFPTERSDTWEVQGRGELQLAVLVETIRREGFELTVGKPQVLTKQVDGKLHEPIERLILDIPEDYLGAAHSVLAIRKSRMQETKTISAGWLRLEYLIPARGLIGLRSQLLTETKGTAQVHHLFESYEPWQGEIKSRATGSLVSDRKGVTTAYSLANLQERGEMFVAPGVEVYEGMIIGESSRAGDMDVNPTKPKKLTNMRAAASDDFTHLSPPRKLSLEASLEFIQDDECVEVTPLSVRLRKAVLPQAERSKISSRQRKSNS